MTPAGIELGTFRFVAQHLNHYATAVPCRYGYVAKFTSWLQYHWERNRYPFYSWLRGPQRWYGCFGREKNPLPLPRLETEIFHPVTQSINRPLYLGSPFKCEEPQLSSKFR